MFVEVYHQNHDVMYASDFAPDSIEDCQNGFYRGSSKQTQQQLQPIDNQPKDLIFSIYPNPAKDFIMVGLNNYNFPNNQIQLIITLTDITGRRIKNLYKGEASMLSGQKLLLSDFPSGSYSLNIYEGTSKLKSSL